MSGTPQPSFTLNSLFSIIDQIKRNIDRIFQLMAPVQIGTIHSYAGATIPDGYLLCDGTTYLITDYPDLFNAIGILHGGNGTTNFKVPNFTGGIFPYHTAASGSVGNTGGFNSHKHTLSGLGQADITFDGSNIYGLTNGAASYSSNRNKAVANATTGGGTALTGGVALAGTTDVNTDTRPPFLATLAMIKF